MHALVHAIDRSETQDMVRIGDRRCVVIDRGLADVVDHPSDSHGASDRSRVVRYVEATTSDSFIRAVSTSRKVASSTAATSAVRILVASAIAICSGGVS